MSDDRDFKFPDEMPIKRKKKSPKGAPALQVYEIPQMSEEDRIQAENNRIADAYALVEAREQEYLNRKQECWNAIVATAAQYGFQLTATHQPVTITVDLQPLRAGV